MKQEEKKERQRKEFRHGARTQKMVSFRCDLDNWEWLQQIPNKGRLINELVAKERKNQER